MSKRFCVVGGSCVDIFAASALPLVFHDSNPGTVSMGFGGVGRNIAENLARLGQTVHLIAAFGSDPFSAQMLSHTRTTGVNTEDCLVPPAGNTPYYISVNEPSGDMSVAVNDMEICKSITPAFLSGKLSVLNACDAVILDTNIPKVSINFLAAECSAPLFADAVSTKKALKLADALPRLYALNTNILEAQALLEMDVTADISSLKRAADRFHEFGVSHVLITLGADGAFISSDHRSYKMKAFQVNTRNANGCGDAFSAAALLGIVSDHSPQQTLESALAAAAVTAQSENSVSGSMSPDMIQTFLEKVRKPL